MPQQLRPLVGWAVTDQELVRAWAEAKNSFYLKAADGNIMWVASKPILNSNG